MRIIRVLATAMTAIALVVPTVAVSTASAELAPKPHRVFKQTKIIKVSETNLQFKTFVKDYKNAPTFLQKKDCGGAACKWHKVSADNTNSVGKVQYRVPAPASGKWYWRIGTPERAAWAQSFSPVWYTTRR